MVSNEATIEDAYQALQGVTASNVTDTLLDEVRDILAGVR